MKDKKKKRHYWLCETCANVEGGVFPEGHVCTVTKGICPSCGTEEVTLIPWVDFDWPNDKQKDITAKVIRD